MDIKTKANEIRGEILRLENMVQELKRTCQSAELPPTPANLAPADRGEMVANAMLGYRHLEDARMRLGKVIQAFEGGVSIYDKEKKS